MNHKIWYLRRTGQIAIMTRKRTSVADFLSACFCWNLHKAEKFAGLEPVTFQCFTPNLRANLGAKFQVRPL